MKKILITGFEPFDQDAINPSKEWIHYMHDRKSPEDREIFGVVLPVTFHSAFLKFEEAFAAFCPDMVILTGLAKNRKDLTIERIGINWVDARIPDNDGITLRAQKIDPNGPDGLFTSIDIEVAQNLVRKNGTVLKLSTSAGEYVCNDLLYKVLCFTKDKNVPTTFIHLPGLDSYDGIYLALETMVYGL